MHSSGCQVVTARLSRASCRTIGRIVAPVLAMMPRDLLIANQPAA
jgi:hypothetical protein